MSLKVWEFKLKCLWGKYFPIFFQNGRWLCCANIMRTLRMFLGVG